MNVHLLAIESNNEIWRGNFDQGMQIVSNSGLDESLSSYSSRVADRLIQILFYNRIFNCAKLVDIEKWAGQNKKVVCLIFSMNFQDEFLREIL